MRNVITSTLLLAAVLVQAVSNEHTSPGSGKEGIHLPIRRGGQSKWKRSGKSSAVVGVGDNQDVTYSVLVKVGDTLTPLILDTGSSDLWLMSDGYKGLRSGANVPLYSEAALTHAGQDVQLLYGDSRTGTRATGPIGTDTVSIAGLSVPDQYFAAIVDTNTTVLDTGSAGILGLGFPPISLIWRQLSASQLSQPMLSTPKRADRVANNLSPSSPSSGSNSTHLKRQTNAMAPTSVVDTFASLGPLLTRLVTWKVLQRPLVVTTLQRDTISLSGNDGTLSLGTLPYGLTDDQLTWVPVRSYSVAEGGLPAPPDAPNEVSVYPFVWEIPIGDVYLDGDKLPRSALSSPSISLSALVDTGNSLIRGPQDVMSWVYSRLGLDASGTFDCSIPHNLTFQIGGGLFPVDPRDFAHPTSITPGTVYPSEVARCTPALAVTDPPGNGGFLYSWSLGDPFLKSNMVAFYYGNMTRPSQDPARVGFMSMVPSDAGNVLEKAVDAAIHNGGIFLSTSESAPYAATAVGFARTMTAKDLPRITQGSRSASNNAQRAGTNFWIGVLIAAFSIGIMRYLP
ncbi:acid protease [Trametes meyenii]|nr:acid protease [Trametes meyenii]